MMKKFFSMMVALAAVLTFAACEEPNAEEKVALDKPVLSITNQTADSFTVSWKAVSHADNYFVECRGVGENINGTEKTFTGLAAGQYTVKVMAVAKAGSKYTDSDYAEITCTIAGGDDWFTQKVYLATDEESGATPSNSLFVDWKGVNVATLDYAIYTAESSKSYSDEEIKGYLKDGSEYLADINGEGLTLTVGPLSGSTEYEVIAYATSKTGQEKFFRQSITTEAAQVADGVSAWVGTWVGTCSKTFTWTLSGQYVSESFSDKAQDVTLTIEAYPDQDPAGVILYGLSKVYPDSPALGYVAENGTLYVLAGVAIGQANQGYTPTWTPYEYFEDEQTYYFISGQFEVLAFTQNGASASSQWIPTEFEDGAVGMPVQFDIYASAADGGVQIYGGKDDFPMDLYAGDFSLAKSDKAGIKKANKMAAFPAATVAPVAGTIAY